MLKTFKIGGIHPCDNKMSKDVSIEIMPIPEKVVIPTSQHIGAPATVVVKKGDSIKVGDVIATATGFVSSNIHSSVSGTVTAVDMQKDAMGIARESVTIAVEGDVWNESIDRNSVLKRECNLSAKEIVDKIAAAGIVGMGGATFPTQVKLSVPAGKKAEFLIINGVECEPYLTADHRVMMEKSAQLLVGVDILCKALSVQRAFIGIENNKPDAIDHLRKEAASYSNITIVPLKVQYPQGGEKQLIDAVISRQVPSGCLPIDVGAVVQNIGTALAVYEAVQKNKPLIERVVTVTGKDVPSARNIMVRVGTPISYVLSYCGGIPPTTGKIINGGPMMGRSICNVDAPVTKGTSGILLMDDKESFREEESVCIRCAKCVSACPMGLEPYFINVMSRKKMFSELEPHKITDCIECGSCSYVCPANIPLLDYIRIGKTEVMKIIRSRK